MTIVSRLPLTSHMNMADLKVVEQEYLFNTFSSSYIYCVFSFKLSAYHYCWLALHLEDKVKSSSEESQIPRGVSFDSITSANFVILACKEYDQLCIFYRCSARWLSKKLGSCNLKSDASLPLCRFH